MTDPAMHSLKLTPEHPDYKRLRKRRAKERRFQLYGLLAIIFSAVFLAGLLVSIIGKGAPAFVTTEIFLPVPDIALAEENPRKAIQTSIRSLFPEVEDRRQKRDLYGLISKGAPQQLATAIAEGSIAADGGIWVSAASDVDMVRKGKIDRDAPAHLRRVNDVQLGWIAALEEQGRVRLSFNRNLFTQADSREPELAGILGALTGSLMSLFICLLVAMPVGIGAAIYLQEFAPKNKITVIIELCINNLAAVPSIVFGLLALAVYLHFFNLPRSSPLVGGLALALLILPIIVVTSRTAIAAVPPSIRDAAIGLGASRTQAMFHHVLPLSLPGIMTGTILSIARALGETAPLLMIGMVAFVADVPADLTSPSTAMPVQIYLWSDSPEMGFAEKTSAAIMILLVLLAVLNGFASWLRKKTERRW